MLQKSGLSIKLKLKRKQARKVLCQKLFYSVDQFQTTDLDENCFKIFTLFLSSDSQNIVANRVLQ